MGMIVSLAHARASSFKAAKLAKDSKLTSESPGASRMMPGQCGLGMPRDRHPLTVLGDSDKAPATSLVPPQTSIIASHESSMDANIVCKLRTCQPFAIREMTKISPSGKMLPMDTDLEVSNRLAALREKLGLDQTTFAASLGIEKSTYNAYERGKRPLTIETAKKIRRRYGVSVDWLLFGDIGQPNQQFIMSIDPEPAVKPRQVVRKKRTA